MRSKGPFKAGTVASAATLPEASCKTTLLAGASTDPKIMNRYRHAVPLHLDIIPTDPKVRPVPRQNRALRSQLQLYDGADLWVEAQLDSGSFEFHSLFPCGFLRPIITVAVDSQHHLPHPGLEIHAVMTAVTGTLSRLSAIILSSLVVALGTRIATLSAVAGPLNLQLIACPG